MFKILLHVFFWNISTVCLNYLHTFYTYLRISHSGENDEFDNDRPWSDWERKYFTRLCNAFAFYIVPYIHRSLLSLFPSPNILLQQLGLKSQTEFSKLVRLSRCFLVIASTAIHIFSCVQLEMEVHTSLKLHCTGKIKESDKTEQLTEN